MGLGSESLERDRMLPPERRIYANRTLNLRALRAVGFDMDYTLIHYNVNAWEQRAYEHARARLIQRGFPLEQLEFDPDFVTLGLIIDRQLGNVVKSSRFGYVTRAYHGTRLLDFDEQKEVYARTQVDLREPRWVFINTLFGMSEATLFSQAVELLDAGKLPAGIGYEELYRLVRSSVDESHMEGALKSEIASDPERFVELDPELPEALLDLRRAGKLLLLVTNSEWSYTRAMMSYAFDRFLPAGTTWRELFDIKIVAARKPVFFSAEHALFEVVDEDGLLRPYAGRMKPGGIYLGGDARRVERDLELKPEDILYIGDHVYADVHVSKDMLRWRTALVLRDLEPEITAMIRFAPKQVELDRLMAEKEELEQRYSELRVLFVRHEAGRGETMPDRLRGRMAELKQRMVEIDRRIVPLAIEFGELANPRWGLLMRSGVDKSYLARQIERYADVYTSRVSNLLHVTPYAYLRAPRASLPHDGEALRAASRASSKRDA
jgi:HAD superfamily 5'-nucleotidase-like hydrolase